MSTFYEVTYSVKKKGAIGTGWPLATVVQAATPQHAMAEVKAQLVEKGVEVGALVKVIPVAPPAPQTSTLVQSVPPVLPKLPQPPRK